MTTRQSQPTPDTVYVTFNAEITPNSVEGLPQSSAIAVKRSV